MKHITKGKVLIIPDIHQNIKFADDLLERESGFDHVVFLGDYFDTFREIDGENFLNFKDTCAWLSGHRKTLGDKATWLVGNHDIPYMATYRKNHWSPKNTFYYCSGYSRNKATDFNKYVDEDWMYGLALCCRVGDYVMSHAGFHWLQFKPILSELENIEDMYTIWENEKRTFHLHPFHWVWDVGVERGGDSQVGSPVWLDWSSMVPLDDFGQVVGHTAVPVFKVRQKGPRTVCLDCNQKMYATWVDNILKIKKYVGTADPVELQG